MCDLLWSASLALLLAAFSMWVMAFIGLVSGGEEMQLFGVGKLALVSVLLYACVVHLPSTHAGCGQTPHMAVFDADYLIHH